MRKLATLGSRGQVTIPQEIRERLGLRPGDKVEFVFSDGVIHLVPVKDGDNPFEPYIGVFETPANTEEVNSCLRDLRDEE